MNAMLGDLLTKRELDALWDRISNIQDALRSRDRGNLLKNARNMDKDTDAKKKDQYIRQYKALKGMKDVEMDDQCLTIRKIFTHDYIDKQIKRLGGK